MFLLYILAVVFSVAGKVTAYADEGQETQQSTPSGWIDFDSSGIYKAKEDAQEWMILRGLKNRLLKSLKDQGNF